LTFQEEFINGLTKPIREGSNDYYHYYQLALAHLALGNHANYREICQSMLHRFSDTQDQLQSRFVTWTACLAPDTFSGYQDLLALYQRSHATEPFGVELGVLYYRMGEFDRARDELNKIADVENSKSLPAYLWYFLAMADAKLENTESAAAWLQRADEFAQGYFDSNETTTSWHRFATLRLLQEEARSIVQATSNE
jgi:tetratricopeptide (TPR) repeat protein